MRYWKMEMGDGVSCGGGGRSDVCTVNSHDKEG